MNNLIKYIIPFFIVLGLHADQGMLSTIVPSATDTQNTPGYVSVDDLYVDGSDVYVITSTTLYKYNLTMSASTSTAVGVGTAKKVVSSANHVFIISSTTLESFNRDINVSEATYVSTKSINSLAVSEDESYIFLGTTTGVLVIKRSDMTQKAFVETTNAKDLKVKGNLLYVSDDWGGLKVIDISTPELSTILSTTSGEYYKLAIENNYIYTIGKTGLSSFDISSPSAPIYKGTTNTTANDSTSLFVQDTYAYIGQNNQNTNEFAIYDVSNKANMQEIAVSPITTNTVNSISGKTGKIYGATEFSGVVVLDAISDYDDNVSAASLNQTEKTLEQLNSDNGIYGNLKDSSDIDFIKLTLQGGRLNAYISGLDDINVSLYDSNDTTRAPIASINSSQSNTPKLLNLSAETASGINYIKIENTDGITTGEYKIIAEFTEDDWPDFIASSQLVNYGEYIKGNMLRGDDSDYFKVDLASKGGVIITSEYADVVDFDLISASSNQVMSYEGELLTGRTYKAVDNGIYYIKAKAATADVENKEYKFRVDFSKEAVLAQEDDAPFALKAISNVDLVQNFEQIQVVGDDAFIVNNSVSTLYKSNKNAPDTPTATYISSTGNIIYYKTIGDYTYVLSDSGLDILYTNSLNVRSSYTPQSGSNKFKVNGDRLFISTTNGTQIEVIDISNKDNPTLLGNIDIGSTVNDFDIKGSFYEDSNDPTIYGLNTYLYIATNSGLKRFNVKDVTDAEELATFKPDNSFTKIVISNPYAYVESNIAEGFSVLYINKAASTPKLKGSVNWGSGAISSMVVHQNNAYIINDSNVVSIIDITDQTAPKKVDIPYMVAKSVSISSGVGYFLKNTTAVPSVFNYVYSYDMSNDYSDVKGLAAAVKYDAVNYGVISQFRTNENDVFYINAERSMELNISAEGNISTTYKLYKFNSDTLETSFGTSGTFLAGTSETNSSVVLKGGEYYMSVSSTGGISGTYNFSLTKTEDDFADSFLYSELITVDETTDAKMLTVDDKDVVKVEFTERGQFDFNATDGIKVTLLYDDTITTLSNSTNTINTTLNPGTYYIVMESNGTFSGDYQFESSFVSNGQLAMPDGFDGRDDYNAEYVIYGDRYIYVIEPDNHVAVYNHLLQRVAREMSADASVDYSNNCGKPFYYDTKLFINKSVVENGVTVCKEYATISVENTAEHFEYNTLGYDDLYYQNVTTVSVTDRSVVNIDNDYLYEYSKANNSIFKTLYSEMNARDEYSYSYNKRTYGYVNGVTDLNSIKSIKNDENIDIVAINSNVYVNKTNPDSPVYATRYVTDEYGNFVYDSFGNILTETYVESYEPVLLGSANFTLVGNVIDMHIDRDENRVYVLTENSTSLTVIDYNESDVTLSTSTSIDIGVKASGMFIKEDKVYMTIEDPSYHGIKVYDYPLDSNATPINEVENIGANLSAPFTWDGTTFNYLSNLAPKVFYLSESFVDGQTTGTYSVAGANNIQEGEEAVEGCFIATAAYGSYFQTHVKVLRDFRDNILLTNSLGKKIVNFYYKHSPAIASNIAMHSGAKNIIRQLLTPIVYVIKYPLVLVGILSLTFFSLFFIACSDTESFLGAEENTDAPVLRDFLANIDQNQTSSQSLGNVEVVSTGGAGITSFRLQGAGYTNFDISSTGVISTRSDTNLDCVSYKNYNLEVIATNKYGDSNKAEALIQVNCGDEPILEPYVLNTYQSGSGTMTFTRTAAGSNNAASDIKEIQLVDAPSGVSVDNLGNINISSFLSAASYDIKVRAVNNNNKIGPYVYLTINTGNYTGDGGTGGDVTVSDDWPNYPDTSVYTAAYISPGGYYNVYGYMNYTSDHDYIKIYIESDNTEVSFSLSTDGFYDYGNGGNYIALYDEYGGYYATYSNNYPSTTLNAGYYFINVHETSNSYTLQISTATGTSDQIGDDIYNSHYLGSVDSYYSYISYDSFIDFTGDRDVFEFYLPSDGNVSIGTGYASFDTYGRLYDSVGNIIAENDDGTDLNFKMEQYLFSGTYYIEVSAYSDSSTGNYNVYVNYLNP